VPSPVVGSWHLVWLELPGSDGALLADTRSDEHWSVTWERD
jgi:hypothetical protein